jgi:hypothetical protein
MGTCMGRLLRIPVMRMPTLIGLVAFSPVVYKQGQVFWFTIILWLPVQVCMFVEISLVESSLSN